MKALRIVLFLIHGCIHFMGFAKAFYPSFNISGIQDVSRPLGLAWLVAGLLCITTALVLLLKREWWPVLGILTVILSQILIVIYWEDAKYATFMNSILLMISISGYGNYSFDQMIQKESQNMLGAIDLNSAVLQTKDDVGHLPTIVQKWLTASGALQTEKTVSVRLRQKGEMKTSPTGRWMPFTAQQYFNCDDPAFIWVTKVNALPLVHLNGRDKLTNAQGEMLIKLFSLFPVVHEGRNEKINAASMQRYLAELCWFPSAASNDYMVWESIDETSAKAILTLNNKRVSGIFSFTSKGEFHSFETKRFYGSDKDAKLETWYIEAVDHKVFNGVKIPSKCKVFWKLEESDFNWLKLEITSLEYNKPYPYK
ncbi:MAG: DUF6544 family protein [Maribacter sp.]|uniref:DUF6920 family protein n=1 Tax=Maribacter sp. TaxID=1897614 RepID=UPI003C76593B